MQEPVSICIETFGTSKVSDENLIKAVRKVFDLSIEGIIEMLDLRRPIYKGTSVYGHFGKSPDVFSWERLDKVNELRTYLTNSGSAIII